MENVYIIKGDKKEFHPMFWRIIGERVKLTGEKRHGKCMVEFIDNPELIKVAQAVRPDLLIKEEEK